jgi:LPXTG-motif cell wall-anchored protein
VIKLQDLSQVHLDQAMLGRWLEITGRLEGSHRADGIREVHVKSFKPVPVVPRRVAEATPVAPPIAEFTPAPTPEPTPEPTPQPVVEQQQPVATAGVRTELPKSGTSLPLFGLLGFASLSAGLLVHLLNRRLEGV